jgi:hypothetical protein
MESVQRGKVIAWLRIAADGREVAADEHPIPAGGNRSHHSAVRVGVPGLLHVTRGKVDRRKPCPMRPVSQEAELTAGAYNVV